MSLVVVQRIYHLIYHLTILSIRRPLFLCDEPSVFRTQSFVWESTHGASNTRCQVIFRVMNIVRCVVSSGAASRG